MIINNKEFEILNNEDFKKALKSFSKEETKEIECSNREYEIFLHFCTPTVEKQTFYVSNIECTKEEVIKTGDDNRFTSIYIEDYGILKACMDREMSKKDIHSDYYKMLKKYDNRTN